MTVPLAQLKILATVLVSVLICRYSLLKIGAEQPKIGPTELEAREALYLPNGQALELLSLGYKNALSDYFWFKTINYFGKHFSSDRGYRWLSHMCNLVVDLDPSKIFAFEFCGNMLAWEASRPEEAVGILDKAVSSHPNNWKFLYMRGFMQMFFLKNELAAQKDLAQAAKLPDAPPIAARLAAKKMLSHDPKAAIGFLKDMLGRAKIESERKALYKRLTDVIFSSDLQTIEEAAVIYEKLEGRLPKNLEEMITRGVIGKVSNDPFGGKYYYDPETRTAKSTSKHKRLKY